MQKHALYKNYAIIQDSFPTNGNEYVFTDENPIKLPISPVSSLHYHNRLEIGICYEGSGIFYSDLKSECIQSGDIIFFLPGVAHFSQSLTPTEPCLCRFTFIDVMPLFFTLFKENQTGINLLSEAQTYNIPAIIREKEYPQAYFILRSLLLDVFNENTKLNFLTSLHLAEFFTKIPSFFNEIQTASKNELNKNKDIVYIVEAFISSHYNTPISIPQLCEICNLSESQLRRRFKQKFDISPMQYLHTLRCNIGSQMLKYTQIPINQIAQKIGYLDISEFYKHFCFLYKNSPSVYRNNHQNN